MNSISTIEIGPATDHPKLNVTNPLESGTIKLSTTPMSINKKSVNFGPGIEMLMNPKKQSNATKSAEFTNLSDIDARVTAETASEKRSISEVRSKIFGNNPIKLNISEMPKVTVTGSDGKLGVSTSEENKKKTASTDGFKTFNEIPVNPEVNVNPKPKMSNEELLRKKLIYLRRLEALEKKGVRLTRKYNMDCSLAEMEGEYEMIKAESEKKSSMKFQGKMLMAAVSAIEFLNSKFDPFDIKLDGWAEAVNENLDEYDDVFGELHEKYAGKAKIAPELKLLFMLGGSAAMLHMTNTMFKSSMPGMDDIMRQNPELMQQFTQAAVNTMRQDSPGFGGFMSGVMGNNQNYAATMGQPPMRTQRNTDPNNRPDIGMSRGNPIFDDAVNMENSYNTVREKSTKPSRPEMKGPEDINSLLKGLKTKTVNIQKSKETDNKSTISIEELKNMKESVNMPQRSKRRKGSAKNSISLNL